MHVSPGVILIGDAAHAVTPVGGQVSSQRLPPVKLVGCMLQFAPTCMQTFYIAAFMGMIRIWALPQLVLQHAYVMACTHAYRSDAC